MIRTYNMTHVAMLLLSSPWAPTPPVALSGVVFLFDCLFFAGATRTSPATFSPEPWWRPASATPWSGTSTSCPTVGCREPLARPSTTCSGTVSEMRRGGSCDHAVQHYRRMISCRTAVALTVPFQTIYIPVSQHSICSTAQHVWVMRLRTTTFSHVVASPSPHSVCLLCLILSLYICIYISDLVCIFSTHPLLYVFFSFPENAFDSDSLQLLCYQ